MGVGVRVKVQVTSPQGDVGVRVGVLVNVFVPTGPPQQPVALTAVALIPLVPLMRVLPQVVSEAPAQSTAISRLSRPEPFPFQDHPMYPKPYCTHLCMMAASATSPEDPWSAANSPTTRHRLAVLNALR